MIMRFVKLIIFVPIAILLIVLSVANRHAVTVALNPFRPEDNVIALTLPLFVLLLVVLMIGVVLGSVATWISQGRHRKRARDEAHEARKWRDEAGRQRSRIEEMNTQKLISASK
ncbi:MAG: putative transrane protein [Rhizobium sp.]|nr:putative transrane protein [Rhizobium sp.]